MAFLRVLYVTVLIGSLSLLLKQGARAEDWGNLGYTKDPAPEVESIPEVAPPVENTSRVKSEDMVKMTASSASTTSEPELSPAVPSPDYHRSAADISTVKNSSGVDTEENLPVRFYAAPFAGITSAFGNSTTNVTPSYAAGVNAGFLLSSSFMIEASFTHGEQNTSGPVAQSAIGIVPSNVFNLKQNGFDVGGRMFFLGRESRFRPFFGGGGGYTRSTLNYNSAYITANNPQYLNDFTLSQVNGYGEVGAEFAITKSFVATAMFKVNAVVSSSTSAQDPAGAQNYTNDRVTVGNSLSQSASYMVGAGVGIYF